MPTKYPNQKHIKIFKEPCNSKNIYAMINIAAMKNAAQQLKPAAFKLWTYFAKNQQHFEFDLSSKAVLEEFNMKTDMYNSAVHELIEKGFLVLNYKNTYYHFYELPSPLHIPKMGNLPSEKQEMTIRNNTISKNTEGVTMKPFQGLSSLPLKQVSMDTAGNELPACGENLPFISAANLFAQQMRHSIYVKYLGNNVIQFPSGKKYRVMEDYYYDQVRVNYNNDLLKDLRAKEHSKVHRPECTDTA